MIDSREAASNVAPLELVDTHCHITSGELATRVDDVIVRAAGAGVMRLVAVACVPDEWDRVAALQRCHPGHVWAAAGIHPHEAAAAGEDDFSRLAEMWQTPGVVGCGEMGLDYHYDFSPRPAQQAVFARQLRMARDLDLPIIIHSREAHGDVVRILLDEGYAARRVVFHCFSGNRDEAAELRSHGWWTSFTGVLTFGKSGEMQAVCRETPADQLMFETDAPYLSPEPVRRMRPNEPANVVHTVRFAASLRDEPFEQLAAASTANAVRFFTVAGIRSVDE